MIKRLVLLLGLNLLLSPHFLFAQATPASGAENQADRDYAAFTALLKATPPGSEREIGATRYEDAQDKISQKIYAAALAFYANHPRDVRRWEVLMAVPYHPPLFLRMTGTGSLFPDKEAWSAWNQQCHEWRDALIASVDAPVRLREKYVWSKFSIDFWDALSRQRKGETVDWDAFRPRFDAHIAAFANEAAVVISRAENYLNMLEEAAPALSATELRRFLDSSDATLRRYATYRRANPVPLDLQTLTDFKLSLKATDRVAFLGDSITRNGAEPRGFITLLEEALVSGSGFKVALIKAGVGGDKVTDLPERLERDVLARHPTIVFVYIGINDVWHWQLSSRGTTKENFKAGLTNVIQRIMTTGAAVVLATPSLIGEKPDGANERDAMLDEYADISRVVAKESGSTLCDLRVAFRQFVQLHNNFGAEYGLLTEDGVHLSDDGNRLVANYAARAIVEALNKRSFPDASSASGHSSR